ncbi:MAG: hypothetical protein M3Y56_15585, partial [Armatimonadota bacterium]|nr:hypothetical protein [Armatimonadota bacterium]
VTPATITITGTTPAGGSQVLTGQQLTATLNVPSGFTVYHAPGQTGYQWAVSSSTAFETYDTSAPDAAHTTQLVPLSAADLSATTLNFYDRAAGTLHVTCTVTLLESDGVTQVSDTVTSKDISVLKPTAQWRTNLSPGFLLTQTGMGTAELWKPITITVPAPFDGGQGCLAQLITPTIQLRRYPLNGQPDLCYYKVPQQNADGSTTWVLPGQGLDTHFPYPTGLGTDANGNPALVQYPNGYQWDVHQTGTSGDGPTIDFSIPAADNGGNEWYTCYTTEIFTTWLMYMPSTGGTGSPVWVPLQRIDWNWNGNVVKDSVSGQWGATNPSNPPGTTSTSDPGLNTSDPPQWTTILQAPNQVYP